MDGPATAVTSLDVAPQGRGPASLDGRHDPAPGRTRPVAVAIGGAITPEYFGQLQALL